ncbi:MAG: hypothetical protein Ct9H300mP13_7870 [Gammaproteobacteria bacterium]|nr:MAG: hypothetical protein Ct9H300mP13_7870 [Gammaproteobacteria bacterium]
MPVLTIIGIEFAFLMGGLVSPNRYLTSTDWTPLCRIGRRTGFQHDPATGDAGGRDCVMTNFVVDLFYAGLTRGFVTAN